MFTAILLVTLAADPAIQIPPAVIHFHSRPAGPSTAPAPEPRRPNLTGQPAAPAQPPETKPPAKAEAPAVRQPPPVQGVEELGIRAARHLVRAEMASAQSRVEKYALSQKLVAIGESQHDAPVRWGAFREAIRLGAEAASPVAALSAVEAASRHFEIDVPKEKLAALRECLAPAHASHVAAPLPSLTPIALAALATAIEAEQHADLETALALIEVAHTAALKGEDPATCRAVEKHREALARSQRTTRVPSQSKRRR